MITLVSLVLVRRAKQVAGQVKTSLVGHLGRKLIVTGLSGISELVLIID